MSRWQANLGWGVLVVLMAGGVWLSLSPGEAQVAAPAKTPAPETLLSSGSVFYIGYDGMASHREEFEKTALYKSLYESGLMDAGVKFFKVFAEQAKIPPEISAVGEVYDTFVTNGVSIGVSVSADQGPALPFGTVVIHKAANLQPQLSQFVQNATRGDIKFETRTVSGRNVTSGKVPDSPGVEVGWWSEGEHLVLVAGFNAVENSIAVASGQADNITKNPLWNKYKGANAKAGMTTLSWLDLGSLGKTFGQMPLPPAGPDAPQNTVSDVLKAVGLDNAGAIVSRSGFKGEAMWAETLVETTGPRKGLLAYASDKPLKLEDLPPLPPDTLAFHACTVDWTKAYDNTVDIANAVAKLGPPDAQAQVKGVLDNLPAIAGFDPRAELVQTLGDVSCIYTDGQLGLFGAGIVVAQKVKDEKQLTDTLMTLVTKATTQTRPQELTVAMTNKQGREIVSLQVGGGFFNPSFAVADGWLVAATTPQSVEAFFLRKDGKLDHWKPNEEHKKALAELPKEFTSLTVSETKTGIKALMGMAPFLVGMGQAAWSNSPEGRRLGPLPFSAAELPPAELVAKPLFPNVRVQTVGEDGIRFHSRQSVPTLPFMDSGGGVPTAAVAVALLLPAVQQAREAARRTQSKNNLKQLGLALHNYHEQNNSFPAGTHPNEKLKPEERLSWLAEILPHLDQQPLHDRIEFDEAWDSKKNDPFTSTKLPVLINPSQPDQGMAVAPTNYVGMAGVGKDAPELPLGHKRAGVFGYNRKTGLRDMTDGASNTVMVSEASQQIGPWAKGGTSTLRSLTKKPYIHGPDGLGGSHAGGCMMLLGDGSVQFISENIDPETMERLVKIADGEPVGDF